MIGHAIGAPHQAASTHLSCGYIGCRGVAESAHGVRFAHIDGYLLFGADGALPVASRLGIDGFCHFMTLYFARWGADSPFIFGETHLVAHHGSFLVAKHSYSFEQAWLKR